MANITKIAEDLSALTVMEAADLSKLLEEKWGVSAAAPAAALAHQARVPDDGPTQREGDRERRPPRAAAGLRGPGGHKRRGVGDGELRRWVPYRDGPEARGGLEAGGQAGH